MTATHLKTILLSLFAMLAPFTSSIVKAQQLQASLSHYSTDNGLTSNAIAYLTHDDYGYLWIATWNGVSRFDGYSFYNYKTGNASGIKGLHNRIDEMAIDQSQNVWLKMYDGRIFVINRQTDRIEDPLVGITDHEDFHVNYFYKLYVTSNGDVLIAFDDAGIYKLRLDRNGLKQQHIITGTLNVTSIAEGFHNDVWAGTNQGVHRIDMSNLTLERKGFFLDEQITQLASNGYNIFAGTRSGKILQFSYGQEPLLVKDIGREITSLYIDSHGLLWFSDLGDGAYYLNTNTGDVKFFRHRILVPEYTSRGAFFREAMGFLWIRFNHGGYGYYNRNTDEVEYFHNDPINPWNLSNSVNANLELNEGVIWESTSRRGLEKLEILKNTIARTRLEPHAESMLENEVRAMYYDKERHLLLIGNKHGSLYLIDQKGKRQVITHDSQNRPFSRFYGINKDSKGNYWLCDKDNGVYKMSQRPQGGYTITNILAHDANDKWTLSSNSAYQTLEDKEGNIWVATYGGGINIIVRDEHGQYKAYHGKNVLKRYPATTFQKIRTIAIDKEDNIWAGTTDGIIIMSLHHKNFSISKLEAPQEMEKGLMSNDIITLACDSKGKMWVGTNSGGLSCTTTKDSEGKWQFENYGIEQGLPSEEIRSIAFDDKGNVWLATDHILCSFDTQRHIFTSFSNLDGVDDTMCSEGAAISLPNGNILIGTLDGYYTIDRSKLVTKTGSLLRLRITDFYVNGELQSPRLTSLFKYYVPESRSVQLPKHNCSFSFRFAALNYQLQHRVHYQYRLDGYETAWRNASKERTATYENLPAGTYRFQVKAFLLEAPDNFDMRTIEVVVPPYFLFSTTAIWIYIITLSLLAIWLLWWYQERLRKKYQQSHGMNHQESLNLQEDFDEPESVNETTDEYEIIEG